MSEVQIAEGKVVNAFGNLLHVQFFGHVHQGEVAYIHIGETKLKAELIEIAGDLAKVQVFEDTRGVALGSTVSFTGELLEAELGPGLIGTVFDGLQNPLEKTADAAGLFLRRGIYLPSLDRQKKWEFNPTAKVGDRVSRGDFLGYTMEGRFHHRIMVPFKLYGTYTIKSLIKKGTYTLEQTIATLEDEQGEEYAVQMLQKWPIKTPLLSGKMMKATEMLDTGMRIIDTQFPIIKGGTFCSPGPFGAGKTVLQHHLSKYSSVDLVVITACGERAGEVVEVLKTFPHLTDPHTLEPLMSRTLIICNTSSMPVAAREASVYMGVTLAEYYRQMGLNLLLLADSTSRWAQAMREMSGRLEEIPGEEAFPAYLASRIAAFYERSGVIRLHDGQTGSLTIGGSVSPAGGNFEEPVTQATLSVVGAFLGLSRARSDARKYPAIDPLISWSKYHQEVSQDLSHRIEEWKKMIEYAGDLLFQGDEIGKRMEVVGEAGITIHDLIIYLKAELYEFTYLQQNAFDEEDAYCPLERQLKVFPLIYRILISDFSFDSHDEARSFFLSLQNELKNMNYLAFDSKEFNETFAHVQERVDQVLMQTV